MTISEFKNIDKKRISEFFLDPNYENLMSNKLKQKEQELKGLNEKFDKFKTRIISKMKLANFNDLKKICEMATDTKMCEYWKHKIELDCKFIQDINFMQTMKNQILPNLESLAIDGIDFNLPLVKEFLFSSFPNVVKELHISSERKKIDIEQMSEIIVHISPKVSKCLYLHNFQIDQLQLKILLQAVCRNITELGLSDCALKFDSVPNLQYCLKGSKIVTIDLINCGYSKLGGWENHPERFSNLIEGLGQSEDFKKSFENLNIFERSITEEYISETLEKFGFDSMEINYNDYDH